MSKGPKPLAHYREKTPLVWGLSTDTKVYVYCLGDNDIRVDFLKKGAQKDSVISLTADQFTTLHHLSDMVSSAVRKTAIFTYELGNLVHVNHQEFRKIWSISIRQYYIGVSGDELPGRWGINLPHDVWRQCARVHFQQICKYLLYINLSFLQ